MNTFVDRKKITSVLNYFLLLTEEQFLLKANDNANSTVCKHQLHLHGTMELCPQVSVSDLKSYLSYLDFLCTCFWLHYRNTFPG